MGLYIGNKVIASNVPGESAYEAAKKKGFDGSEEEFGQQLAVAAVPSQKVILTATEGQSNFFIPFDFEQKSNNLNIFYNGILMKEVDNYTVDISNNAFNLVGFAAHNGDTLTVIELK